MFTMDKIKLHEKAVATIVGILRHQKHTVSKAPMQRGRFDLLVDGSLRIEVKAAEAQHKDARKVDEWVINIHRHGKLPSITPARYINGFEEEPDYVLVKLYGMKPFTYGLTLSIPYAYIKHKKTIRFSLRSLISKWSRFIDPGLNKLSTTRLKEGLTNSDPSAKMVLR